MIGHASADENGKSVGGRAGDSTEKEVCKRSWYNSGSGWHTVLRPKNTELAEKSAVACEAACVNDKIGYDQNQRNTLNKQAKAVGYDLSKITTACECDCSALMHVCAIAGGANLAYDSNGLTTSTMVNGFMTSGDYDKLTDSKYLKSDKYLKRGDILVKTGHTAMCLDDGEYVNDNENSTEKLDVDGKWGKATTTRLQQIFGTTVDGEVSNQLKNYKESNPGLTSGWEWQDKPNGKGSSLIKAMQKWAGMDPEDCDGEIGPKTIKAFQRKLGTTVDGNISKPSQMVKALQRWANEQ